MSFVRRIFYLVVISLGVFTGTAQAQGATAIIGSGSTLAFSFTQSQQTAFTSNGFTVTTTYYNSSGRNNPGFAILDGSLDLSSGTGSVLCQGSTTYTQGNQTLELRNFFYQNVGTSPYLSAAIYENGVYQGREIIYTMFGSNPIGPVPYGFHRSANAPVSFSAAFSSTFASFFQTPMNAVVAPNSSMDATGFIWLDLNLSQAPAQ